MRLEVFGFPTNLHLQHFGPAPSPPAKWSLMILQDLQKSPFWILNIATIGTRFFCIFKSSNLKKVLCHPSLDKESKHLSFGTTTKTSCSLQWSFGINSEFCPVPVLQENPEWPGAFCRPPKIERDEDGWRTQPCTESVWWNSGMLQVARVLANIRDDVGLGLFLGGIGNGFRMLHQSIISLCCFCFFFSNETVPWARRIVVALYL